MNNNDQDSAGNNKGHQEGRAKDDIPSWLQGLDKPDAEGATTEEKGSTETEISWVREIEQGGTEPSNQQEENTRINHVNESNIDDQEYQPEQDNFVEISDIMTNDGEESSDYSEEESVSEDKELPEWLHEMIAEETESSLEEKMPSVINETEKVATEQIETEETVEIEETQKRGEEEKEADKPTQPVDITQEIPIEQEESVGQTPTVTAEFEELSIEPDLDIASIPVLHEEQDVRKTTMPKTLRFAAFLLEQGDYDQAVDIINAYINKPEFLEDIKDWLLKVVNNGAKYNSAVWEALGDIAMKEGDCEQAFNAYAKAIDILLRDKKSHEID